MTHRATLIALALLLGGCSVLGPQPPQFHPVPSDTQGRLPFSDAVRAGDMLYLSGQLGIAEGDKIALVPGGIGPETRRTLERIQATLGRHGATMDDVVRCTVFLADIGEWAQMNAVYVQFFPNSKPARSALGVNGLALGARVEIECLAAVGHRAS